jgi:hypothetical protein
MKILTASMPLTLTSLEFGLNLFSGTAAKEK